ncbi:transcriptional regulator [Hahella sp. CCB-MM4]|uniref:LysR family transcriptional regulator n=1 Tax=Hahella sp. (strain CCB-MM4) TaxID=1926491 RepID=UPI000B9B83F8|nr:LysR family transcriptional regulator [Hahella sp. CCB-MM4]OZG74542.1 transcriptional regulator [Hahella sp. CCB-MM4]
MDLRSLRYYVAAVEQSSITAAAEQCHVAQPSISLAINKLEEELETTLLQRGKKGVQPTPAGRELYLKAQRLLAESEGIVRYFRQKQPLSILTLQMDITLSLPRVRFLLGRLSQLRNDYQLEITRSRPDADIRITRQDDLPENFHFCPLWEDEYCLLLPLDHPLATKESIEIHELQHLPIIERTFCERSQLWEEFISSYQLNPHITAQTDSEEWALALVESGLGACIAPAPDSPGERQINIRPLSTILGLPRVTRTLGIAWNPIVSPSIQEFFGEWRHL